MRLNCSLHSTTKVHWDNYDRANPTVYNGFEVIKPLRERYSVETTEQHRYDLIIDDVRLTDAGNYCCYDQSNTPNSVALLIILRSMFQYSFSQQLY